jgi:hypothetical protein
MIMSRKSLALLTAGARRPVGTQLRNLAGAFAAGNPTLEPRVVGTLVVGSDEHDSCPVQAVS